MVCFTDNKLRCGIITDTTRQVGERNVGTSAKYTADRRQVTLVYTETGYKR